MRASAVISAAAVILGGAYASASVIEYREIFPNATTGNINASTAGWYLGVGNLTPLGSGADFGVSNAAGRPADAVPVNSGPTDPLATGFLGHWGSKQSSTNYLFFTDEHQFDLASKPLESISWYQGNSGYWEVHVALRIDGDWYISVDSFTQNSSMGLVSNFPTQAELKQLNFDTASWATMNADLSQGSITDLPTTGTLEAYGLVIYSPTTTIRFDTFTITVVPEPTAGLAGLAMAGMFVMRRRRS